MVRINVRVVAEDGPFPRLPQIRSVIVGPLTITMFDPLPGALCPPFYNIGISIQRNDGTGSSMAMRLSSLRARIFIFTGDALRVSVIGGFS